jgi:hypothetical protein
MEAVSSGKRRVKPSLLARLCPPKPASDTAFAHFRNDRARFCPTSTLNYPNPHRKRRQKAAEAGTLSPQVPQPPSKIGGNSRKQPEISGSTGLFVGLRYHLFGSIPQLPYSTTPFRNISMNNAAIPHSARGDLLQRLHSITLHSTVKFTSLFPLRSLCSFVVFILVPSPTRLCSLRFLLFKLLSPSVFSLFHPWLNLFSLIPFNR